MESLKVIFYCWHCRDYNKHRRGDKDYEYKDPEIDYFSDAHKHMLEFPDAYIELQISMKNNKD